ncbi:MAG: FG-GAP-like repeat-containing protein [Spirosomataceae bacterium]
MKHSLLTLLCSTLCLLAHAQVTPQGSLSGNAICPGTQATLTFTASAGTGPFTVRYTDGNAIRTQTGVTSGIPFNAISKTTATKTYTLLKVTGADGGTRSSGFTDPTGTVTVSPLPDLKDLALSPIAPVCAGSDATLSLSGFVQTRSFQSKPAISTSANGAYSVYSADLDGDGDMDVLSASVNDDKVAWYENDGSGGFGPQIIISTSADFPTSVYAADLDGDGDLDVLSASLNDDKIAWYQNNGSGGFTLQTLISTSADGANSVFAADLDGDGDMDVLSASLNDNKIAWYENNGSGGFGVPILISQAGETKSAQSVYAADLDGDGDMDVLSASSIDNKIAWYQNNGSGGFGLQNIISTAAAGAAFVSAADLDGDGDMDVLSASQNDNKVAWYENNGSGGFGAQNIISTSAGGTASVHAADLDNDGDLDVLSASGQDNKVAWYENNGSGGFGPQTVISNTTAFAYSVYAADLDGDGDMDVPVAAYHGNRIVWFENRTPLGGNATVTYTAGGGVPKTVTVPVNAGSVSLILTAPKAGLLTLLKISNGGPCATSTGKSTHLRHLPRPDVKGLTLGTIAPVCAGSDATLSLSGFVQTRSFQSKPAISTSANGAKSVYAADLDGDGDLDVLSASREDDKIAWYENNGNGGFGPQTVISVEANAVGSVYAADLDGDGDLDVLSASEFDNKIAWYENNGSGGFGSQRVISTSASSASSVYAADLDGDGDLDVLSASLGDDKIAWYENNGSGGFGSQKVISTAADIANSVYAADLDGDGDMDVLSASQNDNKIAWYENDGNGEFGPQLIISTEAGLAKSVYAADLDGDGDMDVLSACRDNKIAWYENNGSGGFGPQILISTLVGFAQSVSAADLDGDGDIDVLSASPNDNKIAWYENNGSGGFGSQRVISSSAISALSVYAADLDGDGDMDVLSASLSDDKIAWYENRTPLSGNAQISYNINGGSTQTAPITVSSGSASAVIASPVSGTLQLSKISVPGGCETAVSSSTSLSVNPVSVGGTVSAPQTICANTSPADLTLSGQVGSVVRWEKSANASFSSPTPISSLLTTLTSAVMGTLTADTYFRAVVKSGVCSEANSSSVLITVNPQPVGPTLNTKTPNIASVCFGTAVSATFNPGSGGVGCSDDYVVIIDGGSPAAYTPGDLVGATATASVVIQGRRANCTSGSGCNGTAYVTLASWTVKPIPMSSLSASQTDVCPNTQVTLDARCSVPTATVLWNPGAPTITPDAPNVAYVYKASCALDGCTGNESSVEVRTHRILADLKNVGSGFWPKALAGSVLDNLAPTNTITAPPSPRLWTVVATGCAASESAVFKLSGPVSFSSIDNGAPYALFANAGSDFFAIDHPNYGTGGSFPNGTYTLTLELRSQDGVGGPFPKNRVVTGALLATRTLQFTVGGTGATRQESDRRTGIGQEGIEFLSDNGAFALIAPNPVAQTLHLSVKEAKGQSVTVHLTDATGRVLLKRTFVPEANQHIEAFDVSQLSGGLYMMQVQAGDSRQVLKLVKVP